MQLAQALTNKLEGTGTLGRIQVQKALNTITQRNVYLHSEHETRTRRHEHKKYCENEIFANDVARIALDMILRLNDPKILKTFEGRCILEHWTHTNDN